jgi:DNA-binding GntR family transcriptional regulator
MGTKADWAEQIVRAWIRDGIVRPGDRLGPERNLAEQLGVGRTTLRRALGALVADGLLHAIQGSGYYVRSRPSPAERVSVPELRTMSRCLYRWPPP